VAQLEDRRFAPALENLQRLAPNRPGDPMIQYYLGRAFEGLGRKDAAADSYRKALEIAPDLSEARGALARLQGPPG
jgi:Flp pilus assembly protein TadD